MKKITKMYLHADRDSNYEKGRELGITDPEALRKFSFWGYEVEVEVEVDTKTGKTRDISYK